MLLLADRVILSPDRAHAGTWAVLVQNGMTADMGPAYIMLNKYPRHRKYVLRKAVLLPGLVNVHAHLELPRLLGTISSTTYSSWVLNLLRQKSTLTSKDYRIAAKHNVRCLIETGTTTVGEICTHRTSPEVIATSGMRALVYQELISMDPAATPPALRSLLGKDSSLVRYGLSPHSPHTVSRRSLITVQHLMVRRNVPLSMHVAETREEGRLFRREKSGLDRLYRAAGWERQWAPEASSSISYLDRTGMLGPFMLLVHAVDVNNDDIHRIKRSGAAVAHCPRSNHSLHVGVMPLKKMLDAGIPVGLGTDSLASVPTLSLWDEMRFAYKVHRKHGIAPKDIFHMATRGGARALGMDHEIGSLEPGKKADIIAVPLPRKNTGDLYSDLLRETGSSIMTMVNGKIVFRTDRVEED